FALTVVGDRGWGSEERTSAVDVPQKQAAMRHTRLTNFTLPGLLILIVETRSSGLHAAQIHGAANLVETGLKPRQKIADIRRGLMRRSRFEDSTSHRHGFGSHLNGAAPDGMRLQTNG